MVAGGRAIESMGAFFAFVVGHRARRPKTSDDDAFTIPLDDLARSIDLVERETQRSA